MDLVSELGNADELELNAPDEGRLSTGELREWYYVSLVAGTAYKITLLGDTVGGLSLDDPGLFGIYDDQADLLQGSDLQNSGEGVEYAFTVSANGNYYFGVEGQGTGKYSIAVTKEGGPSTPNEPDDIGDTYSTSRYLPQGEVISAEMNSANDIDWFRIYVQSDVRYRFDVTGAGSGNGTLTDPQIYRVYNEDLVAQTKPDGSGVLSNNNGGDGDLEARLYHTFAAGTEGMYFIAVRAADSGLGSYQITYTTTGNNGGGDPSDPVDVDDIGQTFTTARYLQQDQVISAEMNSANDIDWFRIYVEPDVRYRFDVTGAGSGDGTLTDPQIYRVYNEDLVAQTKPDGSGVLSNNNGGDEDLEARLYHTFAAGTEGTYFIAVRAADSGLGSYQITYTTTGNAGGGGPSDPADIGDTIATAQTIDMGTNVASTIESAQDIDMYKASLTAGRTYVFYMKSEGLPDPFLNGITDASGTQLKPFNNNGGSGLDARITYTATTDQTIFVGAQANYNGGTGDYIFQFYDLASGPGTGVIDGEPVDVGDTFETAAAMVHGTDVSSGIETASDEDVFKITLSAGRRYQIDMRGSSSEGGTLADPEIEGIYTDTGIKLDAATGGGAGTDAQLIVEVSPLSDSVYYIKVASQNDSTGTYTLSATDIGAADDGGFDDEDNDTWQGASALVIGDTGTSSIDQADDQDWFKVTFAEAGRYAVQVQGADSHNGTLLDPRLLDLRDSSGAVISGTARDNVDNIHDARLYYDFDAADYYVGVESNNDGRGTYKVSVVPSPDVKKDDYSQDGSDPGLVNANSTSASVQGSIETFDDADYFRSFMKQGYRYQIDLTGIYSDNGTLQDPYFFGIRTSDLKTFDASWNDNSGPGLEARTFFTAPTSDYYFLVAGAQSEAAGSYTLTVTNLGPDANGVPTDLQFADEEDVPGGHPPPPDYSDVPDDFGPEPQDRGSLDVGSALSGTVDYPSDLDFIEIELEAGKHYQIDVKSGSSDAALSNPMITGIYDAELVKFIDTQKKDGGANEDARLIYSAFQTGTHVIAISGEEDETGAYNLQVTQVQSGFGIGGIPENDQLFNPFGPDDAAQNVRRASAITVNAAQERTIDSAGDEDWLKVLLEAGRTYRIDMLGVPNGEAALSSPQIAGIYRSNGVKLESADYSASDLNDGVRITFRPDTTEHYVIAAAAEGSATGAYSLRVIPGSDPDPNNPGDDYEDSTFTVGMVGANSTVEGEIEVVGDVDWLVMDLAEGVSYRLQAQKGPSANAIAYPDILFVSDGTSHLPSVSDLTVNANADITFTAPRDGLFYVAIAGEQSATGTYEVSLQSLGSVDDFSAGPANSGAISFDGLVPGRADFANDADWFSFDAQAGAFYIFSSDARSLGLDDPVIESVVTADGTILAQRDPTGFANRLAFESTFDGTAYVTLRNADTDTGIYAVSATEVTTPPDTVGDEGSLPVTVTGDEYDGRLDRPGDWDVIGFDVIKDYVYDVDLEARGEPINALDAPIIGAIWDTSTTNFLYSGLDNGGEGISTSFTATADGTYYIVVDSTLADDFGDYTVSAVFNEHQSLDVGDTIETAGEITLGVDLQATIGVATDRDVYGVDLVAGQSYHIVMLGGDSGATVEDATFFRGVLDSNSDRIISTEPYDLGLSERFETLFTPETDGRYYLVADSVADEVGSYTLGIDTLDLPPDIAGSLATTAVIALDETLSSVIATPDDVDWIRATLEAGQTYQLTMSGAGNPAVSDVQTVRVFNSVGALVESVPEDQYEEPYATLFTAVAPEVSGTYYFELSGLPGFYDAELTLVDTTDDVVADVTTSASVAVGWNYSGILEIAGDTDWIALAIDAPQTVRIDLGWWDYGYGSVDLVINGVRDSGGALLENTTVDDSGGLLPSLTYSFDTAGTFYIDIGAADFDFGGYTIDTTELTVLDDYTSDIATTGTVEVGGFVTGSIETFGDTDWFAVTLNAGQFYDISLTANHTNSSALHDPFITGVYDTNGDKLSNSSNDDNGDDTQNSSVTLKVAETGTYYVSAGAARGSGDYLLSVSDSAIDNQSRDFEITFDTTDDYAPILRSAATWWEAAISDPLSPITHAEHGLIKDLHILVKTEALPDGQIVIGTPTQFREGVNGLPYLGTLLIDAEAFAGLSSDTERAAILEHGIGHVLGVGTLWSARGLASGAQYTGPQALAEFTALGGTGASIPLENIAQGGTGKEWSEEYFDSELMSAEFETSGPMPMSRITLGALADLGYSVDMEAADDYTLPSVVDNAQNNFPDVPEPDVSASGPVPGLHASQIYHHQSNAALNLTEATSEPIDGVVLEAGLSQISFVQTGTLGQTIVQLTGSFTKQNLTSPTEAKGFVDRVDVFEGGVLSTSIYLGQALDDDPVDVGDVLNSTYGMDLDLANHVTTHHTLIQNDLIDLRAGDDAADGGQGNDTIWGRQGNDTLSGGAGHDSLFGGNHFDILYGGIGNDILNGGKKHDYLDGGSNDDILITKHGNDTIRGGSGEDTVIIKDMVLSDISVSEGLDRVILSGNNRVIDIGFDVETFTFRDVELSLSDVRDLRVYPVVHGTDGDDTLSGTTNPEVIVGYDGDDEFRPAGGNDDLFGGDGIDQLFLNQLVDFEVPPNSQYRFDIDMAAGTVTGDENTNIISFQDIEMVHGSDSKDRFRGSENSEAFNGFQGRDLFFASAGGDTIDGGSGKDTLSFFKWGRDAGSNDANALDLVSLILNAEGAPPSGAELSGIIVDLDNSDNGTHWAAGLEVTSIERIIGTTQSDVFVSSDASVDVRGKAGDDWFVAHKGVEALFGGVGYDVVTYYTASSGVTASLANGGTGGAANKDKYNQIEGLVGTQFDDVLTGADDNNWLSGLEGADVLNGAAGNDKLFGGNGDDTLNGGEGDDTAHYTSDRSAYVIERISEEVVHIAHTNNANVVQTDVLNSVEAFVFADQTVLLDDLLLI
jgi:Ca2+-binding RTX toxin-like protein